MTSPFTFTAGKRAFDVLRFRGRERINAASRYDVLLRAEDVDVDLLLGQQATLRFGVAGEERAIEGVVARAYVQESGLRVRLVPRFALLKLRITSRIFQERDVPAIVAEVLTDAKVPIALALTPDRCKVRSYCLQYQESDLDFMLRRCAEEGIFFVVEDDGAVSLMDEPSAYQVLPKDANLLYRPSDDAQSLRVDERHVSSFDLVRALRVERFHGRDYDLMRPHVPLEACATNDDAPMSGPALFAYEHDSADLAPVSLNEREAADRLEQYRADAVRGKGESGCPRLAPGRVFALEEHPSASALYVVASVIHEGRAPELADHAPTYRNTFTCAPASVALRPERPKRRLQQVTERAVVVGPEGEEIHTDPYGRVKVRFHWDQRRSDEQRSCWIRVTQPWAGAGFGALFTPRVGMEVAITFFGGDVDQPLITGCLYNGVSLPPFPLPAKSSMSGLRTRSTPGDGKGYHELSFDDARGKERVTLISNRDLTVAAANDHRLDVGHDHHASVGGAWQERSGKARTIEAAALCTIVHGASTARCKGDLSMSTGGRLSQHVGGGMSANVEGHWVLDIGRDRIETNGRADAPASYSLFTHGTTTVTATKTIGVHAMDGIVLQCGESAIELRPGGITLHGRSLQLVGAERVEVSGKGPSLRLDEHAEMTSKEIRLFAEEGRLLLSQDARLNGRLVKLNCDDAKPSPSADQKSAAGQKRLCIKLTDPEYGTLSGKRYRVDVDDRMLEGVTSQDGTLDEQIPKGATSARVTAWLGAYPEGEQRTWVIQRPGEGPLASALAKLSNLGYYRGEPRGEALDEEGRAALRAFQRDMKLPETGELDAPTVEKLKTADNG